MLVVSDTSPVTALLQTDLAHLLPELFGRVLIPPAVESELRRTHKHLPPWIEVCNPVTIPDSVLSAHLDPGETEALALALELRADTVLLDDQMGRRAALELHLPVMGLLGLLLLAKRTGRLNRIEPAIMSLREKAGCWFAEALVGDILRAAGEA